MTTTSTVPTDAPLIDRSMLQIFFDRVAGANPFVVNRVLQPSPDDVDAGNVHHAPFARLLDLARTAHEQRIGVGAVLWGPAGVGKSHLLSRLWRWADRQEACFVYLQNLQADPDRLAGYILNVVLSVLTRRTGRSWFRTPLFFLLNRAIKRGLEANGVAGPAKWHQIEAALARALDPGGPGSSPGTVVNPAVRNVLYGFYRSAHPTCKCKDEELAALAVQWLSGDALDAGLARRLGAPVTTGPDGLPLAGDDQHAKDVLVALAQTAVARGQPLVLCFDQVDNLSEPQAAALMRFLQALLDSAPNLLVINSGVQATLMKWHTDRLFTDSSWDRVAQFEIGLQRVNADEARQIVQVRLEQFIEPFYNLDPVREQVQKDALFPLGRRWEAQHLRDQIDLRPRDVVSWAREGWRREQEALQKLGGPGWLESWSRREPETAAVAELTEEQVRFLIDRTVGQKIAEYKAQRELHPETLPPSASHLAELVFRLLEDCRDGGSPYGLIDLKRLPWRKASPKPPYHLEAHQRGEDGRVLRTGVVFVATSSAKSVFHHLERLIADPNPPDRRFLVIDERLPLELGAGGEELVEQLRGETRHPFRQIELDFARLAELDSLEAAIGMAVSGDLEIELPGGKIRRVTKQEVIDSNHRCGRYLADPLLASLAGPIGGDPPAGLGQPVPLHTDVQ